VRVAVAVGPKGTQAEACATKSLPQG